MKFGLATPLQYRASNKEANLILQSHGIGVHHIPGPLVVYVKDTSIGFKPKNSSNYSLTGLRDIDFLGYHCILVSGNFFHHIPTLLVV